MTMWRFRASVCRSTPGFPPHPTARHRRLGGYQNKKLSTRAHATVELPWRDGEWLIRPVGNHDYCAEAWLRYWKLCDMNAECATIKRAIFFFLPCALGARVNVLLQRPLVKANRCRYYVTGECARLTTNITGTGYECSHGNSALIL